MLGDHFIVECPDKPILVAGIRELPGRWFHNDRCRCGKCRPPRNYWSVPVSRETIEPLLDFAERWDFKIEAAVLEDARRAVAAKRQMYDASLALDAKLAPVLSKSGFSPHPYQRAGIVYLRLAQRAFCADEMGLGKTPQGLLTARLEEAFPLLIFCPASLKLKWKDEAHEWIPGKWVQVVDGGRFVPKRYPITICNYDVLRVEGERREMKLVGVAERLAELAPECVIFDESHYLKNPKALRTRAAALLARNARMVLMLTGTPLLNRPQELMSQLRIMGRLEDLGGYKQFLSRYCGAKVATRKVRDASGQMVTKKVLDTKGAGNLEELNKRLRETCFIRRRKREVMPQLPAIQRAAISLEISNRAEYERAKKDLVSWLQSEGKDAQAKRVRYAERLFKLNYLRKLAVRGKWEQACQWCEEFLETGEKLLIFGYHRDVVEGLAARFKAPKIYGDTPIPDRKRINDEFQAGRHQVLVMNLTSGGVGLNLTAASNVAFFEWGWTPGENDQAEARVYGRANDPHGANAWYFKAEATVEDDHLELLAVKRRIFEAASDGRVSVSEDDMVDAVLGRLLRG
jgi:SWI/SNF-related matrix-associated actin-dependent regulator 1 of chromatin subfamily A